MTGEPMTDAEVDRLRAHGMNHLAEHGGLANLLARLDAERSRADAAEAARDAALARAMPGEPFEDEDARRDAIDERRAFLRATRCRCEPGMPGHCPGPDACPYCQDEEPPPDAE